MQQAFARYNNVLDDLTTWLSTKRDNAGKFWSSSDLQAFNDLAVYMQFQYWTAIDAIARLYPEFSLPQQQSYAATLVLTDMGVYE